MTTTTATTAAHTPRRVALASAIGTTIEWYDFYLYATATALVFNRLFFPEFSDTAGTLAAFATYAAGFGARPIGAVLSGHLGDRLGRKTVLVGALVAMGLATTLIGLLPSYATIGVWAPTLLVVLRIVQGLAVGGEWAGAAILAVEHAPPRRRGFFGSFTQLGSPAGMLLATGSFFLVRTISGDAFLEWAWRLPFLASIVLVAVGLVIRLRIDDAPEFRALRERGQVARLPVVEVLREAPRNVALTTMLRISQIALFVLLTTYSLTYIVRELGPTSSAGLLAVVVSSALGLASTPLWAMLSDRVGRRVPYLVGSVGGTVTLLLFFLAVETGSTALVVLAIVLGVNVTHDAMYGPQAAWFAELFSVRLRYSGASLGYGIGSVLGAGFTPLIAAALVGATGSFWLVVAFLAALSVVTTVAAVLARDTAFDEVSGDVAGDVTGPAVPATRANG